VLGFVALPQIWLFQILLTTAAPLVDLAIIWSLVAGGLVELSLPRQGRRPRRQVGRGREGSRRGDDRQDAGHQADRRAGKLVSRVFIEDGCDIKREMYLSLLVDRDTSRIVIMASTEGGMEIEEVAEHNPEKILKAVVDPASGVSGFHCRKLAFGLGLEGKQVASFTKFVTAMYKAFVELDCAIVEINPLVVTGAGEIVALDAKVSFDDSALFRHKDLEALRDDSEMDPKELEAVKNDLNYVALDGEIGCMVNGAGLAMATMDIIKLYGSSPANFLDVGGTATAERVTEAFRIITSDSNVKALLVNIFGGIAKCDMIANGIVEAAKTLTLSVPLVVRLEGTNVDLGKKILAESGLAIIPADNLADAAEKVVAAVKGAK
jgi:succinyl-CoA synthetase beta subunit